jgi:hypothetical protein
MKLESYSLGAGHLRIAVRTAFDSQLLGVRRRAPMAALQLSSAGRTRRLRLLLDCSRRSNHTHMRPLQFGPRILMATRCSVVGLDLLRPRLNRQLGRYSRRRENRESSSQLTKTGDRAQRQFATGKMSVTMFEQLAGVLDRRAGTPL